MKDIAAPYLASDFKKLLKAANPQQFMKIYDAEDPEDPNPTSYRQEAYSKLTLRGNFGTIPAIVVEKGISAEVYKNSKNNLLPQYMKYYNLANEIIDRRESPNLILSYYVHIGAGIDFKFSTFHVMETCAVLNKVKDFEDIKYNILFQILSALYCLHSKYGIIYNNTYDVMLANKYPYNVEKDVQEFFVYNIDGTSYYLRNFGFTVYLYNFDDSYSVRPTYAVRNYLGARCAKVVRHGSKLAFEPFKTKNYVVINKSDLSVDVQAPPKLGDTDQTYNIFYDDMNAEPDIPVNLEDMQSFPCLEMHEDIHEALAYILANTDNANLKKGLHKYQKQITTNMPWTRPELFLANHLIHTMFKHYSSVPNRKHTILDTFSYTCSYQVEPSAAPMTEEERVDTVKKVQMLREEINQLHGIKNKQQLDMLQEKKEKLQQQIVANEQQRMNQEKWEQERREQQVQPKVMIPKKDVLDMPKIKEFMRYLEQHQMPDRYNHSLYLQWLKTAFPYEYDILYRDAVHDKRGILTRFLHVFLPTESLLNPRRKWVWERLVDFKFEESIINPRREWFWNRILKVPWPAQPIFNPYVVGGQAPTPELPLPPPRDPRGIPERVQHIVAPPDPFLNPLRKDIVTRMIEVIPTQPFFNPNRPGILQRFWNLFAPPQSLVNTQWQLK